MFLEDLKIINFRNYKNIELSFDNKLNVFFGSNAQGKTNLLEAIHVLSLTKSHRSNFDKELINWDEETSLLKGLVKTKVTKIPLEINLTSKGKIARINHLEQKKLSNYIGYFNVVLFAPEDLQLIKGNPYLRRKFLDMEFGKISNNYLLTASSYKALLKQRNAYLKNLKTDSKDQIYLEALTENLISFASKYIYQRAVYIKKLEELAAKIHLEISNNKEQLAIEYKASVSDLENIDVIQEQLKNLFAKHLEKDILFGNTQYGPHKEDFNVLINGFKVSDFGSQGQQRTAALSLKLAEIDLIKNETGEYPVLLLDDVFSELDAERQKHLLLTIKDKVQTFITTPSVSDIEESALQDSKMFHVEQGIVTEINNRDKGTNNEHRT